jgi:vacuolar-type H+-ATPase subunit E/Vma4
MCQAEYLALELSLATIIDRAQEQLNSLTRKNIVLDSQLELLNNLTAKLMALAEIYEDTLRRMPEAPYLESKLTRLIEAILAKESHEPEEEGQGIRRMFD